LNGDGRLDVVVSGQVSGDVSVLFKDASHSFSIQQRYRADQDPFGVNIGPSDTTLFAPVQTVSIIAADLTGSGQSDLSALNASPHHFSLLRAAGGDSLSDPQVADTYQVGQGAIQSLLGDFLHNGRQDLAVLATQSGGTSRILLFPNNGNDTFGDP